MTPPSLDFGWNPFCCCSLGSCWSQAFYSHNQKGNRGRNDELVVLNGSELPQAAVLIYIHNIVTVALVS